MSERALHAAPLLSGQGSPPAGSPARRRPAEPPPALSQAAAPILLGFLSETGIAWGPRLPGRRYF